MSRYPDPNVSNHDLPTSPANEEEPHDPRPAMRSRTLLPPSPPNALNAPDLPPILEQNPDTTDDEEDDDPRLPRDLEGGQGDSSFDPITVHNTNITPWVSMQLYHNNIGLFRYLPDAVGPPRLSNYVPPDHFRFTANSTFVAPPEGTRRSALHRTSVPAPDNDPSTPNEASGKAEEGGNSPVERPAGSNPLPQRRVHWSFDDYSEDEEDNEVRSIFYSGLRQQLGLVLPPQLTRTPVGIQADAESDITLPPPPEPEQDPVPLEATRDPTPSHPSEPLDLQEVRASSEMSGVGISNSSSQSPQVIDHK